MQHSNLKEWHVCCPRMYQLHQDQRFTEPGCLGKNWNQHTEYITKVCWISSGWGRSCHLKFLSRGPWILSGAWDFIGKQGLPREHTQDLIILNLKLHGSGQLITAAYETVKAIPKLIVEKTQLSAKKKNKNPSVISQHADLLWRRAQRSAAMNMPLLLEMYCRFAGCKVLYAVTLSICLQTSSQLMWRVPQACCRTNLLTCSAIVS